MKILVVAGLALVTSGCFVSSPNRRPQAVRVRDHREMKEMKREHKEEEKALKREHKEEEKAEKERRKEQRKALW